MDYWVLGNIGECKACCEVDSDIVRLTNGLIIREIDCRMGLMSYTDGHGYGCVEYDSGADCELVVDGKYVDFYEGEYTVEVGEPICDVEYSGSSTETEHIDYPARGVRASIIYRYEGLTVELIYEMYDRMPVMCKRMRVTADRDIYIDRCVVEKLHAEDATGIYLETDYNGGCMLNNNRLLSVKYEDNTLYAYFEPHTRLQAGETFESLRCYELMHDAASYEGRMIEVKEMYRRLFPWVLDNPLIFHVTSDSSRKVKRAVDQAVAVGFDGVIQSFGSGVDIENCHNHNIARHRKLYDYAHGKGIKIGTYTLAIVKNYRRVLGDERNDRAGGGGIFRCLATEWSEGYWRDVFEFYERTGADLIEIDGPYHFYECDGGKTHLHEGVQDSRYMQWKLSCRDVYRRFKRMGVYVNAPDWHYMNGNNKSGIGYEEIAFSQPREEQLLVHRIYNYKGTFNKIPSMGWGFLPIDVYHGGGEEAKFAPLERNIRDYEWAVFQAVMSGVMPCFRGKRLFDGEKSREMLAKWVAFYKKYKRVINGITVHFMPPRMSEDDHCRAQDIDCIFNCAPSGDVRGILAVFNQTDKRVHKIIEVPIFYTGLVEQEDLPVPYYGSGITKVKNPVYGEYPPPYPTDKAQEMFVSELVTGMGATQYLVETESTPREYLLDVELRPLEPEHVMGQVTVSEGEGEKCAVDYDYHANMRLEIDLEPMTFTYYIIHKR